MAAMAAAPIGATVTIGPCAGAAAPVAEVETAVASAVAAVAEIETGVEEAVALDVNA